jgi:hypothetical protein
VEIWCREWNKVPPMSLEQLGEDFKDRINGKLVHSIAFAAASPGLSANGQASVFYDSELLRGLKAAAIAGSRTASPDVPMGQPITYVFAKEKSVRGILDGLRNGRTYITAGPKGPKLYGGVDLLKDGTIDLSFGGVMPLMIPAKFEVVVENAKGKTVQILLNGYPLISKDITNNAFALRFDVTPENYSVYRLRVIDKAKKNPFGMVDVLAMSSPIYAQDVNVKDEKIEAYKRRAYDQPPPPDTEVQFPATPGEGEIVPQFKF